MADKDKFRSNQGNRVAALGTKDTHQLLQKMPGDSASLRTQGKDSPVQRHRKKHPKNKKLHTKGFTESVAKLELGISEVVRKQGSQWVVFDDHTGVQIGAYKSRKAAWDAQRVRRQQNKFARHKKGGANHPKAVRHAKSTKFGGKKKKKGAGKAQAGQVSTAPKVKKVKGIKPIKPIKPLKPIRPKGLSISNHQEAFERAVVESVLRAKKTK